MVLRTISIIGIILLLFSCSKNKLIYEPTEKIDPYTIYKEGYDAFERNDFFLASKKFSEAELNFDDPILAAKAAIMSSFCLYSINFYEEAIESLNRFIKKYPADNSAIYAHYLTALIYFEQMGGEKHDLKPLIEAQKSFDFFLKKYPDSEYAIDLKFKKDLLTSQFAAKELYIANYYIKVQKWIPAINRLKIILEKYENTIFVEEALHRLVEIHYHLGLEKDAKKYASILGYNYNSSEWYKQSYKILNKNYSIKTNSKSGTIKDDNIIQKILKIIKIKR
tara:strand:- start:603 stop:1439 length:837 start_codon:yes stop_codon:yes gene_type:complete